MLLIYTAIAVIFLATGTEGLLLCDGDCANNTELEICREIADSRQKITLLGLFPCNTPVFEARGLTPAAQMAVNQINQHSMLLPGYRLQLLVNNSMVSIYHVLVYHAIYDSIYYYLKRLSSANCIVCGFVVMMCISQPRLLFLR